MSTENKVGRRKTAVARVYVTEGEGNVYINGRELNDYFPLGTQQYKVQRPFELTSTIGKYDVDVNVAGGGITGQVEAVRMGISRALVEINADYKPLLKKEKLLTRDSRMVERKKPGQKKARKRFQFSKR
jgi:small subunit ribosomal protein S9